MLSPLATPPVSAFASVRPVALGNLVRAQTNPAIVGTVVRFSGFPDLWFVQWSDGSCRLCRGAYLETVAPAAWERIEVAAVS